MTPHSKQKPSERINEIFQVLIKQEDKNANGVQSAVNAIINYLDEQYEKSQ